MKVYRYMSAKEFTALCQCKVITGKKTHAARTMSSGICFLGENTVFVANDGKEYSFSPEQAYAFLRGIVSGDVLVEFVADECQVSESCGLYADPITGVWGDTIGIAEYCTMAYSAETMKPCRYCFPEEFRWYLWN